MWDTFSDVCGHIAATTLYPQCHYDALPCPAPPSGPINALHRTLLLMDETDFACCTGSLICTSCSRVTSTLLYFKLKENADFHRKVLIFIKENFSLSRRWILELCVINQLGGTFKFEFPSSLSFTLISYRPHHIQLMCTETSKVRYLTTPVFLHPSTRHIFQK